MVSVEEVRDVVNKLFNKPWSCFAHRADLAMVQEIPEEVDLAVNKFVQSGTSQTYGVERIETTGNMQGIIEMLYNSPRVTVDQQTRPDMKLIRPEEIMLPIATIAEIVYRNGSVYLAKPLDSVEIHETINIYLKQIEQRKRSEPHFTPPPDEDMDAFIKLNTLLEQLAKRYEPQGHGNSAFAALLRIGVANATRLAQNQQQAPVLTINGATNRATIDNHFGSHKDPYSFSNFGR